MCHPRLHKRFVNGDAGIGWVVTCDLAAIAPNPVAAVGCPLVGGLLAAIFGNAKATILVAAFGSPANHGDGHQRFAVGLLVIGHKAVAGCAIGQGGEVGNIVGNVFVIPVVGAVAHVDLPVVAGGGVAAPAGHRKLKLTRQRGVGEVHAVYFGANGVPPLIGVNGERWAAARHAGGGWGGGGAAAVNHGDAVEIKDRLAAVVGVLEDEAEQAGGVAQVGKWDFIQHPLVGRGGDIVVAAPSFAAIDGLNQDGLVAAAAAVEPKAQAI